MPISPEQQMISLLTQLVSVQQQMLTLLNTLNVEEHKIYHALCHGNTTAD